MLHRHPKMGHHPLHSGDCEDLQIINFYYSCCAVQILSDAWQVEVYQSLWEYQHPDAPRIIDSVPLVCSTQVSPAAGPLIPYCELEAMMILLGVEFSLTGTPTLLKLTIPISFNSQVTCHRGVKK